MLKFPINNDNNNFLKLKFLIGPPSLDITDIIFKSCEYLPVYCIIYNIDWWYIKIEIYMQRFILLYIKFDNIF